MIRWLLQGTGAYPTLAQGIAPPGLLNPIERDTLAGFKVSKRRRDWLLGRWTAKHLVQYSLWGEHRDAPPLADIHIGNDPDGVPYAALMDEAGNPYLQKRLPISLSISHSGHRSLCALWSDNRISIGADIEGIEPRDRSFYETFFTEEEIAQVNGASHPELTITAIWSAKEAVLKTLRLGLRVDTRRIACALPPSSPKPKSWTPIRTAVDPALLADTQHITAWWRVSENYVLTLATLSTMDELKGSGPGD